MEGLVKILGDEFFKKDGTKINAATAFKGVKLVGLFFSGYWCPPCRAFSPMLQEFYEEINEDGKKFEVIFMSRDKTESDYTNYFTKMMSWIAYKYKDERIEKFIEKFGVKGIPGLLILDM